jgi:hypothetical protein
MIKIFGSNTPSKAKRKAKPKKVKPDKNYLDNLGKEKLSRLNPMVVPMLVLGLQRSPNNAFFSSSQEAVCNQPHKLTEGWIDKLNEWVEDQMQAMMLDAPDLAEGERHSFSSLIVAKIIEAKERDEFPTPALICINKDGWKYWFKTCKAYDFAVGECISFSAKLKGSGEGISFLSRPTKIKKIIPIDSVDEDSSEISIF